MEPAASASVDPGTNTLMRSPAAERNKEAILKVLKDLIPNGEVRALEIGSGTGQHITYFAKELPNVTWQPSDCDEVALRSIRNYMANGSSSHILPPVFVDTTAPFNQWPNEDLEPASFHIVICINTIHVAPWTATQGLFTGAKLYLKEDGMLITYGPYSVNGEISPDSNVQYDSMLRQQNSEWGLRDTQELERLAKENGMVLEDKISMPANNYTLVFRKRSS